MEQQRFEELARGVAMARSRRDVVKAFIGTILAGGAVAAQRAGALAQDCTTDADCTGGQTCVSGVCTADGPPPCNTDADCTGTGEICCAGGCLAIQCCIEDADPNARCPAGTACFEGVCDPVTEPTACETDDVCADGEICCAGACRAIECCIDDVDPNARCPEGTSCFEGVCDPITEPGACASDADCPDGEICCAGYCRAIECCIDEANPNARCPAGTSCFEGYCDPIDNGGRKDDGTGGQKPVVQLPSTGAGPAAGGSAGMLSAMLAGGAAIAAGLGIRARRVRPAESENSGQ